MYGVFAFPMLEVSLQDVQAYALGPAAAAAMTKRNPIDGILELKRPT
jgi:hypothetical protein